MNRPQYLTIFLMSSPDHKPNSSILAFVWHLVSTAASAARKALHKRTTKQTEVFMVGCILRYQLFVGGTLRCKY
jgi:hypothetical protein